MDVSTALLVVTLTFTSCLSLVTFGLGMYGGGMYESMNDPTTKKKWNRSLKLVTLGLFMIIINLAVFAVVDWRYHRDLKVKTIVNTAMIMLDTSAETVTLDIDPAKVDKIRLVNLDVNIAKEIVKKVGDTDTQSIIIDGHWLREMWIGRVITSNPHLLPTSIPTPKQNQ